MAIKKEIISRLSIVYIMMFLLAVLIIGKIFYIQIGEHDKWTERVSNLTQKDIVIEPQRGNIYSFNYKILTTSVPFYEIRMDLGVTPLSDDLFIEKVDTLAACLSNLFKDRTKDDYRLDLVNARDKKLHYHLIQKRVNYIQYKALKKFPIFRRGRNKGGLICIQENTRTKPFKNLASRTLGRLKNKGENETVVGLEGAYNVVLKGKQGVRLMQKISSNTWMPLNNGTQIEAQDGDDIITTLDINLQDIAEKALRKQLENHGADHGTVVLMEVKTGRIKAIANLKKNKKNQYYESYNYAIGEATEPGSTFKLASLMVALEDNLIQLHDTVHTGNGSIRFYNFPITDSKKGGHGTINIQEVFEFSSNVGVSKIINSLYKDKREHFINRLYNMGLNDRLGLKIKGEPAPNIKYPDDEFWSQVSLPQMSIGYEITLTPLQILTFYNAIANNGKMIKPQFVYAIRHVNKFLKIFDTEVIKPSICSRETIKKAKIMLEGVVKKGTARNIYTSKYRIAGKTGTAQLANKKYGYQNEAGHTSHQASFVGYFPADNPQYSCIVVINRPTKLSYYGNHSAAPAFREIADKIYARGFIRDANRKIEMPKTIKDLPYSKNGYRLETDFVCEKLQIPVNRSSSQSSPWIVTQKQEKYILYGDRKIPKMKVPLVKGMGAKDAIYLLEKQGLKVVVKGRGAVSKQSIAPGTQIVRGDKITLELS